MGKCKIMSGGGVHIPHNGTKEYIRSLERIAANNFVAYQGPTNSRDTWVDAKKAVSSWGAHLYGDFYLATFKQSSAGDNHMYLRILNGAGAILNTYDAGTVDYTSAYDCLVLTNNGFMFITAQSGYNTVFSYDIYSVSPQGVITKTVSGTASLPGAYNTFVQGRYEGNTVYAMSHTTNRIGTTSLLTYAVTASGLALVKKQEFGEHYISADSAGSKWGAFYNAHTDRIVWCSMYGGVVQASTAAEIAYVTDNIIGRIGDIRKPLLAYNQHVPIGDESENWFFGGSYSNGVQLIDADTLNITKTINLSGYSMYTWIGRSMAVDRAENLLYVCFGNSGSSSYANKILTINLKTYDIELYDTINYATYGNMCILAVGNPTMLVLWNPTESSYITDTYVFLTTYLRGHIKLPDEGTALYGILATSSDIDKPGLVYVFNEHSELTTYGITDTLQGIITDTALEQIKQEVNKNEPNTETTGTGNLA